MTKAGIRTCLLAAVALVVAACGGSAASTPATAPTASPSASPASTGSSAPSATAWTVGADSKATVSVREQLAGISFPSDAVLVAKGAAGSFTLNADGTFSPDSKITFDLTTLTSDARQRDEYVKGSVLQTRQFPTAVFVPIRATGAPLPLPANADLKLQIAGKMTIRGVTKDVSFAVVGKREGSRLTATATADPSWKFADFGMQPPTVPGRVLSIVDEIRVAVDLVATGPAS